jgi:hypothetical protein
LRTVDATRNHNIDIAWRFSCARLCGSHGARLYAPPNVHRVLRLTCRGDAKGRVVDRGIMDHIYNVVSARRCFRIKAKVCTGRTIGSSTTELWLQTTLLRQQTSPRYALAAPEQSRPIP